MIRFVLVVFVVALASFGGYTIYQDNQPSVRKSQDIAAQVGQVAEETTRKVVNVSKKVGKAANAAKEELTK